MENIQQYPKAELLTTQQAADYLGLQKQTLDKWRCTKCYGLPFVRLGGRVRYNKSDLDNWINTRTETAEQPEIREMLLCNG